MAAPVSLHNTSSADCDSVQVTLEDQQKINIFARKTNKLGELQAEIQTKQKDVQNMQDALDELELGDEDSTVPYLIGEVFVSKTVSDAQALMERAKSEKEEEIADLERNCESIKETLADLKAQLYAKFGNNINLEMDEA
ncbi:prefoldin subunit 4-like [Acanthaster planci]|uniref:Prefoldin subunit 4 n=1 Tax=Acanthaster planci TaxID=133434 RepID=A0A8B7XQ28_ACAPL|nr:prefoldin subunit 4-like [Acanthaster planci]